MRMGLLLLSVLLLLGCEKATETSKGPPAPAAARQSNAPSTAAAARAPSTALINPPPAVEETPWEKRLKPLNISQVIAAMDDPANGGWPEMSWRSRKTVRPYAAAEALLRKLEQSEAADPSFNPDKARELAESYLKLAACLRKSTGYANQLLADSCVRIALTRLGRWAIDRPADRAAVREVLSKFAQPGLTHETLPALAKAELDSKAKLPEGESKARQMDILAQQLSYAWHTGESVPPALAAWVHRTEYLLQKPAFDALVRRMREADFVLTVALPHLLDLLDKGTTRQQLEKTAAEHFGTYEEYRSVPSSDLFAEPILEWQTFLRSMLYPGVGTYFENSIDRIYALAIDPPAMQRPDVRLRTRETPVLSLSPTRLYAYVSPSGKTWACVDAVMQNNGSRRDARMIINGVAGKTYPAILSNADFGTSPIFSPRGEHVAYIAGDNNSAWVVIDTTEGPKYRSIVRGSLGFSADGSTVAYVAAGDQGHHVVVGDKIYGPYGGGVASLAVSADGKTAAWIADVIGDRRVFVNGKDVDPAFGPAGDLRWMRGVPERSFELKDSSGMGKVERVLVSADGQRWAYLAKTPGGAETRIGGRDPLSVRYPYPPLCFSPDGKLLVSWRPENSIAVNGTPVSELPTDQSSGGRLADTPFGPDGTVRFATFEKSWAIDGEGRVKQTWPGMAFFSPSGRRTVVGRLGGKQMDQYNSPGLQYDLGGGRTLAAHTGYSDGAPAFGPDDRFYSIGLEAEHPVLFTEDDAGPPCTQISRQSLSFSPDGTFCAVWIRRGFRWRLSVSGTETSDVYDNPPTGTCHFTSPTSFFTYGYRDKQLIRIEVDIDSTLRPRPALPPATAPTTLPTQRQPAAPSASAVPSRGDFVRQIVVPDTMSYLVRALLVGNEPVLVHGMRARRDQWPNMAITSRHDGAWKTETIPGAVEGVSHFDAIMIKGTIYLAISYRSKAMRSPISHDSLQILSCRDGRWSEEYNHTGGENFGSLPSLGEAGGKPFLVFHDDYFKRRGNHVNIAERDDAGKWTVSDIPVTRDSPHYLICASKAQAEPSFVMGSDGSGAATYGSRKKGEWTSEEVQVSGPFALMTVDGTPTIFGKSWGQRSATGWKIQPLQKDDRHPIVGADATMIGGRPFLAYLERESNELHLTAVSADRLASEIIDFGVTNSQRALSMVALPGGIGIAYQNASPDGTCPLIWLEQKPKP